MSGERYQSFLVACCIGCFIPILLLSLMFFRVGLSERRKLNTYVETDCLVINTSLTKCGVRSSKRGDQQCFHLKWRIEYPQYESDEQAVINRSTHYLKHETYREDELRIELRQYEVCTFQYKECNTCLKSVRSSYRLGKSIHVIILPPVV